MIGIGALRKYADVSPAALQAATLAELRAALARFKKELRETASNSGTFCFLRQAIQKVQGELNFRATTSAAILDEELKP